MQVDLLTLILVGAGIAFAVVIAVLAGTLAARLFFHASGLAEKDTSVPSERQPR